DDQLAALVVGKPALGAVLPQHGLATRAQPGLEAAGLVVDARVHDTGVAARLVHGDPALFLQDDDTRPRTPPHDLPADREPDDARPHDAGRPLSHSRPPACVTRPVQGDPRPRPRPADGDWDTGSPPPSRRPR